MRSLASPLLGFGKNPAPFLRRNLLILGAPRQIEFLFETTSLTPKTPKSLSWELELSQVQTVKKGTNVPPGTIASLSTPRPCSPAPPLVSKHLVLTPASQSG